MVEGTTTNTVACLATVRLYLWETVVTTRGFSSFATLAISLVLHSCVWMPYSQECFPLYETLNVPYPC
jgi:hypothetical protein